MTDDTDHFAAFNDDPLAELLAQPLAAPKAPPATYRPTDLTEPCGRCRGSGTYRGFGQCFACKGKGKVTRRQAGAQKGNVTAIVNKANAAATFAAEHKAELEWLHAVATREETKMGTPPFTYWEFPVRLRNGLTEYGTLTDAQVAAVRKCMARDAERATQRREAAPVADAAGVDRLKQAFDHAIAYTAAKGKGRKLKSPRITLGCTVISPAKATSANAGALYVKEGETYLGKIMGGRFMASRECSPEAQTRVLAFIADPKAAAEAYGIETGTCCICNATLTNKVSIERGIGPICAEKMGW